MRTMLSAAISVILAALAPLTGAAGPTTHSTKVVAGADISWPNCPKGEGIPTRRSKGEPMPRRSATFVIVGLTNGPGFTPNPCLASQVAWAESHRRQLGAYAMTTYPTRTRRRAGATAGPYDSSTRTGRLRNAGYAEATWNVGVMRSVGIVVPMVWVDVEPYPVAPWSRSHTVNRAVVTGAMRGYRDAGYRVGLYTYANGWRAVVGAWRLRHVPAWTTVGRRGRSAARRSCTRGPSGGRAWLAQWYTTRRDFDLVCSAGNHRKIFGPA